MYKRQSQSFYQVNPAATQILYQHALNMANIGQHTTFLDAYCGTGTIGICAAAAGGQGTGVELNPCLLYTSSSLPKIDFSSSSSSSFCSATRISSSSVLFRSIFLSRTLCCETSSAASPAAAARKIRLDVYKRQALLYYVPD